MSRIICALVCLCIYLEVCHSAGSRKNVLFLVSDDMRPEIGAYHGRDYPVHVHPKMHTPNLDKLAGESMLLKRAFVQQAVCSPSRTSLLTGRRPDTTHVYDLTRYWREAAGNFTTIPQYFKEQGYLTLAMGKIFHPGIASNNDDPISWSKPNWQPDDSYWREDLKPTWYAASTEEVEKHPLIDMQTAEHAKKTLTQIAQLIHTNDTNFFLAVGFHKPHLPFVFPEKFLEYYPENDIRLPNNPYAPSGLPEVAWSFFDELRFYPDIRYKYGHGSYNTTLPDFKVKELRRAYYSALSYTDSLVGEVVDMLKSLDLDKSTIVSFWGDHGWQLGEHAEWCKHTNFELATHAPMMVKVPGLTEGGLQTEELTEFVDLFPTLAEAAGLPKIPLCPKNSGSVKTCTEGVSLLPLMLNPNAAWKKAAFSQYPKMLSSGDTLMGYRIRVEGFSYVEWVKYDPYRFEPLWKSIPYALFEMAVELYDLNLDPGENVNRALYPQYTDVREKLSKMLKEGWRAALPKGNE